VTPRKPRGLRADEKELWDRVKQSTVPLHRPEKQLLIEAIKSIAPTPPKYQIPDFRIGQKMGTMPTRKTSIAPAALRMDAKNFGRLKKGKISPQARIDLHGMTLAQAHPALIGFILRAHSDRCRLVLVITGKGRLKDDAGPIPMRKGVLKHQVPQWLSQAPLGPIVQQVTDAHIKHGGGGALYVYLRRLR